MKYPNCIVIMLMCSAPLPIGTLICLKYCIELCKFCFTEYLPTEPVETHYGHNYVEIINQNFLNKLLFFDRSLLYPVSIISIAFAF